MAGMAELEARGAELDSEGCINVVLDWHSRCDALSMMCNDAVKIAMYHCLKSSATARPIAASSSPTSCPRGSGCSGSARTAAPRLPPPQAVPLRRPRALDELLSQQSEIGAAMNPAPVEAAAQDPSASADKRARKPRLLRRNLVELTKPGVTRMCALTAAGAAWMAMRSADSPYAAETAADGWCSPGSAVAFAGVIGASRGRRGQRAQHVARARQGSADDAHPHAPAGEPAACPSGPAWSSPSGSARSRSRCCGCSPTR